MGEAAFFIEPSIVVLGMIPELMASWSLARGAAFEYLVAGKPVKPTMQWRSIGGGPDGRCHKGWQAAPVTPSPAVLFQGGPAHRHAALARLAQPCASFLDECTCRCCNT